MFFTRWTKIVKSIFFVVFVLGNSSISSMHKVVLLTHRFRLLYTLKLSFSAFHVLVPQLWSARPTYVGRSALNCGSLVPHMWDEENAVLFIPLYCLLRITYVCVSNDITKMFCIYCFSATYTPLIMHATPAREISVTGSDKTTEDVRRVTKGTI